MNIYRYLAALLVAPALTMTQLSLAQSSKQDLNQRLTMQSKPAIVRIVNLCSGSYRYTYADYSKSQKDQSEWIPEETWGLPPFIGTGFFINHKGYILTNARVIEEDECKERVVDNLYSKVLKTLDISEDSTKFKQQVKDRIKSYVEIEYQGIVILPNTQGKLLPFNVRQSGRERKRNVERIGEDIAIIRVTLENASVLLLGDSDRVKVANEVITIGYPENDLYLNYQGIITDDSTYEATFTKGSISNPYIKLKGDDPVMQVGFVNEKQVSLGSPVLDKDGRVIGMISRLDNNLFVIPSSNLLESISQSSVNNEENEVSQLYKNGLEQYWKKDYKGAKEKFERVKRLSPEHSEVARLLLDIENELAVMWVNPLTDPTYKLLLALVAGGGVVAAIAYFLLRHQSSAGQAPDGSPGASNQGKSVFVPPFQSNGNGVGKDSFLELEYKGQIQSFQLHKDEHRLGRDPAWSDFDIPTSWELISRHHAILRKEGENYRIYDGDGTVPSRNGLWIDNDIRVDHKDGYPLVNGDKLKIGKDVHEQITLTYYNPNSNQAGLRTTKMAN